MAGHYPYGDDYDRQWQPYDVPDHGGPSYSHSSPPPPPPVHQNHPGAHPSSSYNQMQNQRHYGGPPSPSRSSPPRAIMTQGHPVSRNAGSPHQQHPQSPAPRYPGQRPAYQPHDAAVSPGGDHLGPMAVGGGITGVAYGVAGDAPRESGVQALRDIDNMYRGPPSRGHDGHHDDPVSRSETPYEDAWETPYNGPQRMPMQSQDSASSFAPLATAAYSPGHATPRSFHSNASLRGPEGPPPGSRQHNGYGAPGYGAPGYGAPGYGTPGYGTPTRGPYMPPAAAYPQGGYYQGSPGPMPPRHSWYDNPYDAHSISRPLGINDIDPNSIADDGDEGLEYISANPKRRSLLSLGRGGDSRSSLPLAAGAVAVGAAAGAAGAAAASQHAGGLFGGNPGSRDASGAYAPVHNGAASGTGAGGAGAAGAAGGAGGAGGAGSSFTNFGGEKAGDSEWLATQNTGKKRMKKWIIGLGILILLAAIAGGVVGGILGTRGNSDSSSGSSSSGSSRDGARGGGSSQQSADEDDGSGILGKDSSEIKDLMGNEKLHKVFPGIDYTPLNTQYPECLTFPPSQNNVTRDMAILSQLTNTLRLYGTDCNQTEMALTAIDRLGLTDMKLWLGVWLGNNDTTNARQIRTAWNILDKHGADPFAGVAVGNEVLFREDLTATELQEVLSEFKKNLTRKRLDLPVATSDLGSKWTTQLASEVDVVMANVHPFFAGIEVDTAASWTWTFWQNNDVAVSGPNQKNIISEVGWPSGGGTDCGTPASGIATNCSPGQKGAKAGVPEQNQFMNDWVCQALRNGTDYFWFEAFDEPWKERFNRPGARWETQWGLMDVNRNLKDGLEIPDCGGRTVSKR